jgi:hypothetical protein
MPQLPREAAPTDRPRMALRVADTGRVRWIPSFSRSIRVMKPSVLQARMEQRTLAVAYQ